MSRKIAVYGGSFNPPGLHHRHIVQELSRHFDAVVVVPCGPRPEKPSNDSIPPVYRAAMTDVIFSGIPKVEVDLFDLEQATFTRTHALEERYAKLGEVWHVVGTDLVAGGYRGESFIQRTWEKGSDLWERSNFAVINRLGHEVSPEDFPPRHHYIPVQTHGSSRGAREKVLGGHSVVDLVGPNVAHYIDRNGLYRGTIPSRSSHVRMSDPRLLIVHDPRNTKAGEIAKKFEHLSCPEDPNLIVNIGGDGSMLDAIHAHWRKRVPFFGVNAGHLGFLLNDADEVLSAPFPPPEMISRQMPMLHVEMELEDGTVKKDYVFNDAWVERSKDQSAWLKIDVDGYTRLPKLVCDGALVSTAAGSTAYAHSMGATPLLADTPAWLVVGSNVMQSQCKFKSALLSYDSQVEITGLNIDKRPLRGTMSGKTYENVRAMRARVSRTAAVELTFCPNRDMAEKIAQMQFPRAEDA
jgi:NAD kinase/nicotinic acid mononucleotide adenylyltransferase